MGTQFQDIYLMIYGDSLSLPRIFDGIGLDTIYSYLLYLRLKGCDEKRNIFYFNRAMGGHPISDSFRLFRGDLRYFKGIPNRVVILHCGVVDCAPRPVPIFLRNIIDVMPPRLKEAAVRFLHKNRSAILKSGLGTRVTSPGSFKKIYKAFLTTATSHVDAIFVMNIIPTTSEIDRHSPGFQDSIDLYNALIREAIAEVASHKVHLIDLNRILPEKGVVFVNPVDGHHLTKEAHQVIVEILLQHEYFQGIGPCI